MTAARLDFARALELVCRHLNPPHQPLPASVPLADLGLEGVPLRADDMLFAYRYLRGLEVPGSAASSPGMKPIWLKQRGLLSLPTVVTEVKPGLLAVGDLSGAVRLFTRRRGRWEGLAAMPSHRDAVRDIVALEQGGFLSAAADGTVMAHRQNPRGQWHGRPATIAAFPTRPANSALAVNALCQTSRDTVIAAGYAGTFIELRSLASGEWEQVTSWSAGASEVIALTRHREHAFFSLTAEGNLQFWTRAASGNLGAVPAPGTYGPVKDIAAWRNGIVGCTERGEIVSFATPHANAPESIECNVSRVASAALLAVTAIGEEHVATWSADRQLRIWAREDRQFSLRATLDVPEFGTPCLTALCDGRVVYAENRGLAVAAPQSDTAWRAEEIVSGYDAAVTAVAPLGERRVAYVDSGKAVRVLRLEAGALGGVEDVFTGSGIITALAALDTDTLAIGDMDGRLVIARAVDGVWRVEDLAPTSPGSVTHLSGSPSYLARGSSNGDVAIWAHSSSGAFELKETFSTPGLSALSIDDAGRIALAAPAAPLTVRELGSTVNRAVGRATTAACAALRWESNGSLLVLDVTGQLTRETFEPQWQQVVLQAASPGFATARFAIFRSGGMEHTAYAKGCAPLEIGPQRLSFVDAEIQALASSADLLYIGADALYVFQLNGNGAAAIRRILVNDRVVMEARLDEAGAVKEVQLRPRDPAASWNAVVAGGKAYPGDALLHEYVAVLEPDGTLGEIHTSPSGLLSADRRTFRVEDLELP